MGIGVDEWGMGMENMDEDIKWRRGMRNGDGERGMTWGMGSNSREKLVNTLSTASHRISRPGTDARPQTQTQT